MAKRHRRKSRKARAHARKVNPARKRRVRRHARRANPVRRHRRARRTRRHARRANPIIVRRMRRYKRHTGRRGRGPLKSFRTVLRNPLGAAAGFVRLPTLQELLWVSVGALGLPFVSSKVREYLPASLQIGWGGIASEFAIGMVASGAARKFAGGLSGDLLFTLVLAKAVGQVALQVAPQTFGIPVATSPAGVSYYEPNQGVSYYEPGGMGYSAPLPGFNDADGMPSMLNG